MEDDTGPEPTVHYDLLRGDAVNFKFYIGIKELRSGVLESACRSFQENVERIGNLSAVPQMAVGATTRHILMLCQATFDVLGKPVMDDTEVQKNRQAIAAAYEQIAATRHKDDGFFSGKHLMLWHFECSALYHHKHESESSPLSWSGYYALLASQVIGAWTALESLIEDVWVAAVNAHPELAIYCLRTCLQMYFVRVRRRDMRLIMAM